MSTRFRGKKDVVKSVQAKLKVVVDGIPGPKTWGAIAKAVNSRSVEVADIQKAIGGLDVDGDDGPKTWNAILKVVLMIEKTKSPVVIDSIGISEAAYNLILKYEVGGGKKYYNRRLIMPTWPGAASGVTIGIGYDLGYNTVESFKSDWGALLPRRVLDTLAMQTGKRGSRASSIPSRLSHIKIPWDAAEEVFKTKTLPKFIELTKKTFPGYEALHPDAFGALVSLVYNRGSAVIGSTRVEMSNIQKALAGEIPGSYYDLHDYIATQIRLMKRIWRNRGHGGLLARRDAEAKLIEDRGSVLV
jgi:GH24 family phage-related lysozyme (muramidase)